MLDEQIFADKHNHLKTSFAFYMPIHVEIGN